MNDARIKEGHEIRVNYGYADGSGEYYLRSDTDGCDGCGDCVRACPEEILEMAADDSGESKAVVKPEFGQSLGYACLGYHAHCREREVRNFVPAYARSDRAPPGGGRDLPSAGGSSAR